MMSIQKKYINEYNRFIAGETLQRNCHCVAVPEPLEYIRGIRHPDRPGMRAESFPDLTASTLAFSLQFFNHDENYKSNQQSRYARGLVRWRSC